MNFLYLLALFVSHIGFLFMGYKYGRRVQKWENNQKNVFKK